MILPREGEPDPAAKLLLGQMFCGHAGYGMSWQQARAASGVGPETPIATYIYGSIWEQEELEQLLTAAANVKTWRVAASIGNLTTTYDIPAGVNETEDDPENGGPHLVSAARPDGGARGIYGFRFAATKTEETIEYDEDAEKDFVQLLEISEFTVEIGRFGSDFAGFSWGGRLVGDSPAPRLVPVITATLFYRRTERESAASGPPASDIRREARAQTNPSSPGAPDEAMTFFGVPLRSRAGFDGFPEGYSLSVLAVEHWGAGEW